MDPEELTFEQAFTSLEQTVAKLSEGTTTLEEAVALFEQGMRLVARCSTLLDTAELRVSQLADAITELDDDNDANCSPRAC